MKIRVRATLVDTRTGLVNAARGLTKAMGERLPACDDDYMGVEQMVELPAGLQQTLKPLLEQVESLTARIKECDREIEQIARSEYPETCLLRQSDQSSHPAHLAVSRARASHNCQSPKKETSICESCWCRERITYSVTVARIRT